MKIYDTLLPNGMPYHHHMEDQLIINRKGVHSWLGYHNRNYALQ